MYNELDIFKLCKNAGMHKNTLTDMNNRLVK